jgi:hypothetical protein
LADLLRWVAPHFLLAQAPRGAETIWRNTSDHLMFHKIKSPYWRAAFWAAVIVIPTYLMGLYALPVISADFMPPPHSRFLVTACVFGFTLQIPGAMINSIRATLFSARGSAGAEVIDLYVPVFSWMFYFGVLLGIFLWRQRREARKQLGETPRTT